MKESDILLGLLRTELKERTDRINHFKNCPHCGEEMTIGATGPGEHTIGCYHNPDCVFKTNQTKSKFKMSYRVDLHSDYSRQSTLEREIPIILAHQFFEAAEQLGDLGEIDSDEFFKTAETIKQLYNEVLRMWKVIKKDAFEPQEDEDND